MHDVVDRRGAGGASGAGGGDGAHGAFAHWGGAPASFRAYVDARKYDFGRGSAAAWSFIALARGDRSLPDAKSWRELEAYLKSAGSPDERVAAARSVWRSFTAHRSRARRQDSGR